MKLFIDDLDLPESDLKRQLKETTLQLHQHPLYHSVTTMEDVRTYMEYQVWCVWDFMALLKSMEKRLLPDRVEWVPPADGTIAAFIYEILLTEETDITQEGSGRASHFESYVRAMRQAGANTAPIDRFISKLKAEGNVETALGDSGIPVPALSFVQNTLKHAQSEVHETVSVFCLSREGIIPGMFTTFLDHLTLNTNLTAFHWYLRRHVELDSDSHGPLSVRLFQSIVGQDPKRLEAALIAALDALTARRTFLDLILNDLKTRRS
jgi:hypothetical protein